MACRKTKEKKRKDYTFRRQFNEKPNITQGCPGLMICMQYSLNTEQEHVDKLMKLELQAGTKSGKLVDKSQAKGLEAVCQCRLHHAVYNRTRDGQP